MREIFEIKKRSYVNILVNVSSMEYQVLLILLSTCRYRVYEVLR